MGVEDPKSGPHVYTASALPTETSPQHQFLVFNYMQSVLKYPTFVH